MPLPLAMMIPFMGIQSAVMAKQFGENFQFGKRRISAMSNEEFNKLTPAMLQEQSNAELKAMIPHMQASIQDMRQFQEFMVKEMLKTVGDLLTAGLATVLGLSPDQANTALQNINNFLTGAQPPIQPPVAPSPQPEPVGPVPETVVITPQPIETGTTPSEVLNEGQVSVLAQGLLVSLASGKVTGDWSLRSKINGSFVKIKDGALGNLLNLARALWPASQYKEFQFKRSSTLITHYYYVLISKL